MEKLKRLKKERQQQGKKKVAAQEDANAREDKQIQSLCPDLDLKKKGLPPPSRQSQNKKPVGTTSRPDDIHPQVTMPVIESPFSPFIELTITDADSDINSVGLGSPDDLSPVSVAATSESKGPTDADMDVDSTSDWGYEAAPAPEIEPADDNGSSDEYQEPEHDDEDNDEEDEQILYQEFLAQRRKTKKVSTDLQAESSSNVVLASDKTKPSKAKIFVLYLQQWQWLLSRLKSIRAAKCPKAANVGGLVANWEKMYKRSEPAASTTSLATTNGVGDDTDDLSIQPTGEFSKDEDPRVVKAARQAKDGAVHGQVTNAKSKKAAGLDKKSVVVELKLADVNEIDGKERAKSKTRKTAWKFEDLPLSTTADIKLFKQCITATLEDQFSSNNHAELKPTVVELWNHTFSHLPKYLDEGKKELCVDHLAIMGVVQTQIRSHRKWVKNALKNKWFVYDKPENNASDGRGSYLRPLIIQTMAYYVQRTFNTPRTFGPPAGALALAAAVVKWALQAWKKGANGLTGKQSKNSPESFGEDPWASVVKQHFKNTQALSKDKWNEILLRCREFSAGCKVDEDDGSSDSEEGEESEDVDLSG
ncbi:hypothetical protein EV421DRAFT_1729696 [Armillaria borealis]|uniref:DUF6532 domain-containing protein n=1 Tax=Armillaria borealis TaxID=47425 RepID=A0AA39K529_9AGAR|nr:hypothetical protein EV421DRAFT_1729696 [Armillaria borealis]